MNPEHATNWLPGLMVLGAGAAIALAYLFGSKRLQVDAPAPETLDDLDARYQAIIEDLRTHVANKHLLPAEEFAREKARLEQAAAEILRTRDGKKHEETKKQARAERAATAAPTLASKNPALMGALMGAAVVAFFVLLGWQLTQSATEKSDQGGMMPQGMGGNPPMQQRPQRDPKLDALAAKVQSNPDDVDAVASLALHLIKRQAFDDAQPLVKRATFLDPFNPRGRVGRAVSRALEGDLKGAIDDLEALAARYPEAYDASYFAGMLAMEDNDQRRALKNLEQYVALAPQSEQPPMMRMAVSQLKQELAGAVPQP